MIDILEEIAKYLATALSLQSGKEITYNEMLDAGIKTVCVQALRPGGHVFPQIDAELHNIQIVAREASNTLAYALAMRCHAALLTESGIVELEKCSISVEMQGTPIWQKTDQQARKYYYFTMKVISKRLN